MNEIEILEATILYNENKLCALEEALSFQSLSNQYDIEKLYERFQRFDSKYKIDGLTPIYDFSTLSKKDKVKISTYLGLKRIGGTLTKNIINGTVGGFVTGVAGTELARIYGHQAIDAITGDRKYKKKETKEEKFDRLMDNKEYVKDSLVTRAKADLDRGGKVALAGAIIGAAAGTKDLVQNKNDVTTVEVRIKDRDIFVQKDKNNKIYTILLLYQKKKNGKMVIKVFKTN